MVVVNWSNAVCQIQRSYLFSCSDRVPYPYWPPQWDSDSQWQHPRGDSFLWL